MGIAAARLVGFVCLTLAGACFAAEPRLARFTAYDAGDTHVLTSRSASQARALMDDLAKFRATLEKLLNRKTTSRGIPTYIVIASNSDWEKYLQPRRNVIGWFQSSRFANYIVMNGDADRGTALATIFHEYTHYYLASQFAGVFPPWFNEGLAELMTYTKFTTQNTAVLQTYAGRAYDARDSQWIPFDRLLIVDQGSPEYTDHEQASDFYAQAWLTVHYGMVENREFGRQMIDYLDRLNRLVPQAEATRAFGDLATADKLLREYSRNTKKGSGVLALGEVRPFELGEGKPVSEPEALGRVVDLMFNMYAAPDRIRPLVDSMARLEPKSARAAIMKARLANYDGDSAAFERSIAEADAAIAPNDWKSRRDLALVVLIAALDDNPTSSRGSADDQRDIKRALRWFGDALTHNIDDVEALWGFGTAATRLNVQLDLAEEVLLAAWKAAPANASIAVSLASLYGVRDEPEKMVIYLKESMRCATDLSTRRWAKDSLERTESWLAERAKADDEYRKQREEYERQLAEYEKKYGKRKK